MSQLIGQAAVAVVATAARTGLTEIDVPVTLKNLGGHTIYYRYDSSALAATLIGATKAAIMATGGIPVHPGEFAVIPPGIPHLDMACITGGTATVELNPGVPVESDSPASWGLTTLAVNAAKSGTRNLLAAPAANKAIWVHGGIVTALASGTVKWIDSTPADLTGDTHVAAGGGYRVPLLKCAANKILQVVLSANVDLDGVLKYRIVDV